MKLSHVGRGRKTRGLDARVAVLERAIGGALHRGDLQRAEELNSVRRQLLQRLERRQRRPQSECSVMVMVRPGYLALPVAARRLGVSTDRLLTLIRFRRLPAKLVGGARWFVREDALEAFARRRAA